VGVALESVRSARVPEYLGQFFFKVDAKRKLAEYRRVCELMLLGVIPSGQGASAEQNMSGIPAAQFSLVRASARGSWRTARVQKCLHAGTATAPTLEAARAAPLLLQTGLRDQDKAQRVGQGRQAVPLIQGGS